MRTEKQQKAAAKWGKIWNPHRTEKKPKPAEFNYSKDNALIESYIINGYAVIPNKDIP